MEDVLFTLDFQEDAQPLAENLKEAIIALESGKVVFCPQHCLINKEFIKDAFFSEALLDGRHKNISYTPQTDRLSGYNKHLKGTVLEKDLQSFMYHFAQSAKQFVETVFPQYKDNLRWGRTSYRPAKVEGRQQSPRKDDTRLHVDSFAASPVYGQRILRLFCNINPKANARVWNLGEPFPQVLRTFANGIPRYNRTIAKLLHWLRATKTLRSPYDHYQLHLHDTMKLNQNYQDHAKKTQVKFPAHSTWAVFTDQASHAALGGQFLLEQTFYLPVSAMQNPDQSPLRQWQQQWKAMDRHYA